MYSTNSCGLGNRLRCFLSCLIQDETSVYKSPDILFDYATKDVYCSKGKIIPFRMLFKDLNTKTTDIRVNHNWMIYSPEECKYVGEFFTRKTTDNYRHKYVELRKKFLIPQDYLVDRCFNRQFEYGFQIRLYKEVNNWAKTYINHEIIDFIKSSKEPIFLACDNKDLLNDLAKNKNVFYYKRKHKDNFNLEWDISVMELLTIGKCNKLFLTIHSTYGDTGYLFGDCKAEVKFISEPFNQEPIIN